MRRVLTVIAPLCLLVPATAAADMVSPPPDDCPPGSVGQTLGHSGTFCAPHACRSDEGCGSFDGAEHLGGEPPYACRPAGLCVRERSFEYGGRYDPEGEPPPPRVREVASRPCESDADCSAGRCVVDRRCVHAEPEPEAPPPRRASGETEPSEGGCAVDPTGGEPPLVVAAAVLALLRRRRLGRT